MAFLFSCPLNARSAHVMTTKSFEMDDRALAAFAEMRTVFGVATDGAVVERLLSLGSVAHEVAGDSKVITMDGPGGKKKIVLDR